MRDIDKYIWVNLNGMTTLIVSDNYKGHPQIMFEYDQIIVSKKIWKKYKDKLVFKFKEIKHPKVVFCNDKEK